MSAKKILVWVALCCLAPVLQAASTQSLYTAAYWIETGERNPEAAIAAYEKVIAAANAKDTYALRARYRMGLCEEILGHESQALDDYRNVLSAEAPTEIHDAAQHHLAELELKQAQTAALTAPKADVNTLLALPWLTHWSLAISPGVAVPVANAVLGGSLHRSAALGIQGLYRLQDHFQAGLEFGYAFGYSLDFPPPLQITGAQTSSYRLKVLQLTPVFEVGQNIKTAYGIFRPYAITGVGLYNLNQEALFKSGNLLVTTSDSNSYSGVNVGGGLSYRATRYLELGPDVRYHQVFAPPSNFHSLIISFRIALLL